MKHIITLLSLVILSFATQAADKDIYADGNGAIRGADPVAYFSLKAGQDAVIGSDKFTHEYKGATWKFASAENRDKFIANPEKYAPQYGGYCAFAASHGFTKAVQPNNWKVVNDKLYLNYNDTAHGKWERDQDAAIRRADNNWPRLLKACEKRNQCGRGLE